MPLKPGHAVFDHEINETRSAVDGVEAGDPVSINADGDMAPADAAVGELAGVAKHSEPTDGYGNALGLQGAYVVAVDAGVAEGDRLGLPDSGATEPGTPGALVTEAGGPALALSAAGGTWHGDGIDAYAVPDGYAVVLL